MDVLHGGLHSRADIARIQHHVSMLQDPVELAEDVAAELVVNLVVLHQAQTVVKAVGQN